MSSNILIVDDSITCVETSKSILEKEKHRVFVSRDAKNIVDMIVKNNIDIVLLDIVLPDENGFDILKMLQSTDETKDIPVIIITNITSAESVKRALDCGAMDYIRKPFEPIELIARIGSAIRMHIKRSELIEASKRDALTKLYNRRYFNVIIEQIIQNKRLYNNGVSLAMMDCDYFKNINDTFGHTSGDTVLAAVSEVLIKESRSSDIACRYGGEEFCLILPNTSYTRAYALTDKIRKAVEKIDFLLQGQKVTVTISCGIGHTVKNDGKSAVSLINDADAALYAAKRSGRNRTEIWRSFR